MKPHKGQFYPLIIEMCLKKKNNTPSGWSGGERLTYFRKFSTTRFHFTRVDDKGRDEAYLAGARREAGTLYHLLTRKDTATHWGRLKVINLSNGSGES